MFPGPRPVLPLEVHGLAVHEVDDGAAAQALEQVSRDDERERAAALVDRKLARTAVPEDRSERDRLVQRLVGMLGRRGYHPSLALSVVLDAVRDAATDVYPSEMDDDI